MALSPQKTLSKIEVVKNVLVEEASELSKFCDV
jgi:hypothetical protein